jgi:hypothetical protein
MAKSAARNPAKRPAPAKPGKNRKWSAQVSKHSNALDLEEGVFKKRSARQIALSLKSSAEASRRRKGTPFQSAMSMLSFELNRAGKGMPAGRRHILENAKDELRRVFGRD